MQPSQSYLWAVSYFRPDWPLIIVLLAIIGLSTLVGLLMAWPMAVLVDSVMVPTPQDNFIHRLFLAPLPAGRLGQVIGLAVIGLLLKSAQTLRGLKGSRTIILVSHRLSTVMDCDQRFVMDHGRIVERGTHAQLLGNRRRYYDMARHQLRLGVDPAEPRATAPVFPMWQTLLARS